MNSTIFLQIKFRAALKKFPSISEKDSNEEYKKLYSQIFKAVQLCLEMNASKKVLDFLNSRYVCPLKHSVMRESNMDKLAEVVTSALREPELLKNVCFSNIFERGFRKKLLEAIEKSLSPKISCNYREMSGRAHIEFKVA